LYTEIQKTQKPIKPLKKTFKNLKPKNFFYKKLGFFPALHGVDTGQWTVVHLSVCLSVYDDDDGSGHIGLIKLITSKMNFFIHDYQVSTYRITI